MFIFAVGVAASLAAVSYVTGSLIVSIMFSAEFSQVTGYLPVLLAAIIVKLGAWVISYHMIVYKRLGTFIVTEIAFGLSLFVSTHLMTSALRPLWRGLGFWYQQCHIWPYLLCVLFADYSGRLRVHPVFEERSARSLVCFRVF